ncbi:hypothetical protein ASE00_12505 [Sphingomonas sp. Root710]|uniref:BLUF domain-containing protein n=1 Tax=Sphingomonas sp. Root710 TaxID=1736594 RepID=UPI0006FFD3EB|nr:BLUF domain-containing protein [Sphingomonas sp. Root710]KRB82834.1 hypothetical protein ASE00_12505 [Sphingomonas sp. Root710]
MDRAQRVLHVEDEPLIRMLVAEDLEEAGYAVEMAASGSQAISILQQSASSFDAVITDIRLGDGPDGWQVAKVARGLNPALPVIYMTGDSAALAVAHAVPEGIVLQKPHCRAELLAALDLLLLDARVLAQGDAHKIKFERSAEPQLYSWIYISRSLLSPSDTDAEIRAIVEVSRRNNARLDLSGALMLAERTFAQVIEGPQASVIKIQQRILADARHADVKTLWDGRIERRRFAEWSLAYSSSSHFFRSVMAEIAHRQDHTRSGSAVIRLMSRLSTG